MSETKTIGNFEVEISEELGRVAVQYKNSEIRAIATKEFSYHPSNAVNEYNSINTVANVKKFFASAHNCYIEVI